MHPDSETAGLRPRLLVSVRNGKEAAAALEGGCSILDVKDPDRGALGFAGIEAIDEVIAAAQLKRPVPISIAAGEVLDWSQREVPAIPSAIHFVKVGLAGLVHHPDFTQPWMDVRTRFDAKRSIPSAWVAVAYADHRAAHAPSPRDVLKAAIKLGFKGFLIDTWQKSSGTVFELFTPNSLGELFNLAKREGMLTAIAGRLQTHQISQAIGTGADTIAVRSAACRNGDRKLEVDSNCVRTLCDLIRSDEVIYAL